MDAEHGTLGERFDVAGARFVRLWQGWSGLGTPFGMTHCLTRTEGGELRGEGTYEDDAGADREVPIVLTAATTMRFLAALAAARWTQGPYVPAIFHTCDHPSLEIELLLGDDPDAPTGRLLLYSNSQGEFHTPWGGRVTASTGEESFVLPGDEVGRALVEIERALRVKELCGG